MRPRVGVQTWSVDVPAVTRYWRLAEELGYDAVTYGDGLGAWTLDGWVMLGLLAATTRRVRIGPAVTYAFDVSSHHPAWLAKRAATVDHVSGGRLDLRLAVGPEDASVRAHWEGYGIPFPARGERLARLEETVRLLRALWRAEPLDHAGRFFSLRGARIEPAPVQRPGPPLWIAAMGTRALTVVARCADGWEASQVRPAAFAEKWRTLARLLDREGRGPHELRRSIELDVVLGRSAAEVESGLRRFCARRGIGRDHPLAESALLGTPEAVLARIGQYVEAGVTDLMLGFDDFPDTGMATLFAAEVLPALLRP
jgi:alkanesulfonate monooxygenase SsuD/methylene tetrahydromethanopterin reductase-like flavin-dependent oxidoreductase (luciferase family)